MAHTIRLHVTQVNQPTRATLWSTSVPPGFACCGGCCVGALLRPLLLQATWVIWPLLATLDDLWAWWCCCCYLGGPAWCCVCLLLLGPGAAGCPLGVVLLSLYFALGGLLLLPTWLLLQLVCLAGCEGGAAFYLGTLLGAAWVRSWAAVFLAVRTGCCLGRLGQSKIQASPLVRGSLFTHSFV